MNLEVHPSATPQHIPFLVEAICAAERVPSGVTMYEAIYGVSSDELRVFLSDVLMHASSGRPLALGSFRVVTDGALPVGCCASWIEPDTAAASGTWIAMALSRHMGIDRFRERGGAIRTLAAVAPQRAPGTLQLESFFVRPEYRGRGVTQMLIAESCRMFRAEADEAQISLLHENVSALSAYAKAGFVTRWQSDAGVEAFAAITGSLGFVQLTLAVDHVSESHPAL